LATFQIFSLSFHLVTNEYVLFDDVYLRLLYVWVNQKNREFNIKFKTFVKDCVNDYIRCVYLFEMREEETGGIGIK